MKALITKTAIITACGLIVLCLLLWGIFSWFAPSVMVSITDGLGMEKSAAGYSVSVYEKTGDIDDLSSVVERNFSCGKYKISAKYGIILLEHEKFDDYQNQKQSNYRQTISGIVAVSQYNIDKKDQALQTAVNNTVGEFDEFNGLERLLVCAMEENDKEFVQKIRTAIEGISLDASDAEGIKNKNNVLEICDAFLN